MSQMLTIGTLIQRAQQERKPVELTLRSGEKFHGEVQNLDQYGVLLLSDDSFVVLRLESIDAAKAVVSNTDAAALPAGGAMASY